jgi:hypothetical protein
VILHPFLMLNPPWWEGAQRVLAVLADLARAGRASVGPGGTVAEASS